jgi:hypothetical protein
MVLPSIQIFAARIAWYRAPGCLVEAGGKKVTLDSTPLVPPLFWGETLASKVLRCAPRNALDCFEYLSNVIAAVRIADQQKSIPRL